MPPSSFEGRIRGADWSPDGKSILIWGHDGITIRDALSGELLIPINIQITSGRPASVVWAKDSEYIYATVDEGVVVLPVRMEALLSVACDQVTRELEEDEKQYYEHLLPEDEQFACSDSVFGQ